jgi:hypothetical protein
MVFRYAQMKDESPARKIPWRPLLEKAAVVRKVPDGSVLRA